MSNSPAVQPINDGGGSLTVDGTVGVSGTVDTELPAAVALGDTLANPTSPLLGACLLIFDTASGQWERLQGNGTNIDGVLNAAIGSLNSRSFLYALNSGGNFDRITARGNDTSPIAQTTLGKLEVVNYNYIYDQEVGNQWQRFANIPAPSSLVFSSTVGVASNYMNTDTLLASAARTASGNSLVSNEHGVFKTGIIQLNVTAASGTVPTLDVYIDSSVDGATTFINMVHFTQMITTGRRVFLINENASPIATDFDGTADLAAGVVRNGPWGSLIRVRWVITGTAPSFTFKVEGTFKS